MFNKNKFIFLDGAMGTYIQKMSSSTGEIPEVFNITQGEQVSKIHKKYIDAGADIITTNTFGANRLKLKRYDLTPEKVIKKALENAKRVSKDNLIALDVGPTGKLIEPCGELTFDEAYDIFKEQVILGEKYGADLILIETMCDIYEAKAAVLAAKENTKLKVICTSTFQNNKRTLTGTDAISFLSIIGGLSVDAIGINCSQGPKEMIPIIDEMLKYSKIPLIVQPNAGIPKFENGETIYNIDKYEFAKYIKIMAEKGVRIFGGCCGTNHEYIIEMKKALKDLTPKNTKVENLTSASSLTKTVFIKDGLKTVGEKINPSGNKYLKECIMNKKLSSIVKVAIEEKNAGTHILDVNLGLPDIDEKELMKKVVGEIEKTVDTPLQIDSSNVEVIKESLRYSRGKPIINSLNGNKESMDAVFPLAKKYGNAIICLTLDEKGIPKTSNERVEIAKKIIKEANKYKINKENLIFDPLVLTASAQQQDILETLKAVYIIKNELKCKTSLGISNISFGLPNREAVNRTFLSLAMEKGLDLAIINPYDEGIQETIDAFNIIHGLDKNCLNYVKKYSKRPSKILLNKKNNLKHSNESNLKYLVEQGLEDAELEVKNLLEKHNGIYIIEKYLIPALDELGEKYEKGYIFLPELIQSAKIVQNCFKIIGENSKDEPSVKRGKIILATVKDDIHDIGKNLVKMFLQNYGFEVIDLGKDVHSKDIIKTAKKEKVKLIGLSALMTITLPSMEKTIREIKNSGLNTYIMVGGAVLTKEYAKKIGADFYAKDGKDSVEIAKMVFSQND